MATSSLFCSKRLLILCFAEKKENATHSQLSSEIQSGEKPSLYYLIYFSCLRSSLFSISLSPSIVNSSCKLSKSTILLKKIFKFNFQVSASLDSTYQCCVCVSSVFFSFQPQWLTRSFVNSALVHCSWIPQTPFFINFFIKNRSHGTIHTFKNYFATVFSVLSFQFQ